MWNIHKLLSTMNDGSYIIEEKRKWILPKGLSLLKKTKAFTIILKRSSFILILEAGLFVHK